METNKKQKKNINPFKFNISRWIKKIKYIKFCIKIKYPTFTYISFKRLKSYNNIYIIKLIISRFDKLLL